jgi:hypothetical protein
LADKRFASPVAVGARNEVSAEPMHVIDEYVGDAQRNTNRYACDYHIDGQRRKK